MKQSGEAGSRWGLTGVAASAAVLVFLWWLSGGLLGPGDGDTRPSPTEPSAKARTADAARDLQDMERTPEDLHPALNVLSVRVTGTRRVGAAVPIAGADVVLLVDGQLLTRRKTDSEGRASMPLAETPAAALLVRAPGDVTNTARIDDVFHFAPEGETLEVRLDRTYPLRGKVGAWGTEPVPAGVAVLTWSGAVPPTRDQVAALLERDDLSPMNPAMRPHLMLTHTTSGGGYRFPQRVPAGAWSVIAAGQGLATHGPVRVHAEDNKSVVLTAWSAHTLAVQVTDHQGVPLAETPGVSRRSMAWPAGSKLQHTEFDPLERLLLNVEPPAHWGPLRLVDVRSPDRAPSAGPVRINIKEPGFQQQSVSLDVPRTTDGLLLHTVAMVPTWEELGELTVVLEGWDAHVGTLTELPLVTLDLVDESGRREHVSLKDIVDDRVLLSGIPHGSWKAHLWVSGVFGEPEIAEQVVVSAAPATLRIDLTHFGSLDVELVTPSGAPYRERVSLFLGLVESSVPGVGEYYVFQHPPYRIPFVSPRKWRAHLQGTHTLENSTGAAARGPVVELSPGETGRVRLVVGGP